jgi:hypothetical protein
MTDLVGLGDSASVTVIRSSTLTDKVWPYVLVAFIVFLVFLFLISKRTRAIKNKECEGLA